VQRKVTNKKAKETADGRITGKKKEKILGGGEKEG